MSQVLQEIYFVWKTQLSFLTFLLHYIVIAQTNSLCYNHLTLNPLSIKFFFASSRETSLSFIPHNGHLPGSSEITFQSIISWKTFPSLLLSIDFKSISPVLTNGEVSS